MGRRPQKTAITIATTRAAAIAIETATAYTDIIHTYAHHAYGAAIERYDIEIRLLLLLLLLLGLIAIIVVVDFVPIQSHLDSITFSATNIADDSHRPIH